MCTVNTIPNSFAPSCVLCANMSLVKWNHRRRRSSWVTRKTFSHYCKKSKKPLNRRRPRNEVLWRRLPCGKRGDYRAGCSAVRPTKNDEGFGCVTAAASTPWPRPLPWYAKEKTGGRNCPAVDSPAKLARAVNKMLLWEGEYTMKMTSPL